MNKNSINKVFIVGHIGNKPEGRYTASGRATVNFSVATNQVWKNANNEQKEHTEWHQVVAWDKLADFVTEFVDKGQLVSVEGRLHTRSWENKEGKTIKITEIVATNVVALK